MSNNEQDSPVHTLERSLFKYCEQGRTKKVQNILEQEGNIPVDIVNTRGQTLLYVTCLEGHLKTAVLLLKYGADPNKRSNDGSTPTHAAAFSCCADLLQHIVVKRGGDMRLHDELLRTPKDWALAAGKKFNRKTIHLINSWQKKVDQDITKSYQVNCDSKVKSSSSLLGYRRNDQRNSESKSFIACQGYGKFLRLSSRFTGPDVGLAAVVPLASPAEFTSPDNEPSLLYRSPPVFIMEGALWCGHKVTIKRIKSKETPSAVGSEEDLLIAEANSNTHLRHPNLLLLMSVCLTSNADSYACSPIHWLVYEHVTIGSLHHLLHKKHTIIILSDAIRFLVQISEALMYMHERGFIHCAVTSHAVHITTAISAKLGDLSYMCRNEEHARPASTLASTFNRWLAPEVILKKPVSPSTDTYGFCQVVAEILSCELPWAGYDCASIREHVLSRHNYSCIPDCLPHSLRNVLSKGLRTSSHKRLVRVKDVSFALRAALQYENFSEMQKILYKKMSKNKRTTLNEDNLMHAPPTSGFPTANDIAAFNWNIASDNSSPSSNSELGLDVPDSAPFYSRPKDSTTKPKTGYRDLPFNNTRQITNMSATTNQNLPTRLSLPSYGAWIGQSDNLRSGRASAPILRTNVCPERSEREMNHAQSRENADLYSPKPPHLSLQRMCAGRSSQSPVNADAREKDNSCSNLTDDDKGSVNNLSDHPKLTRPSSTPCALEKKEKQRLSGNFGKQRMKTCSLSQLPPKPISKQPRRGFVRHPDSDEPPNLKYNTQIDCKNKEAFSLSRSNTRNADFPHRDDTASISRLRRSSAELASMLRSVSNNTPEIDDRPIVQHQTVQGATDSFEIINCSSSLMGDSQIVRPSFRASNLFTNERTRNSDTEHIDDDATQNDVPDRQSDIYQSTLRNTARVSSNAHSEEDMNTESIVFPQTGMLQSQGPPSTVYLPYLDRQDSVIVRDMECSGAIPKQSSLRHLHKTASKFPDKMMNNADLDIPNPDASQMRDATSGSHDSQTYGQSENRSKRKRGKSTPNIPTSDIHEKCADKVDAVQNTVIGDAADVQNAEKIPHERENDSEHDPADLLRKISQSGPILPIPSARSPNTAGDPVNSLKDISNSSDKEVAYILRDEDTKARRYSIGSQDLEDIFSDFAERRSHASTNSQGERRHGFENGNQFTLQNNYSEFVEPDNRNQCQEMYGDMDYDMFPTPENLISKKSTQERFVEYEDVPDSRRMILEENGTEQHNRNSLIKTNHSGSGHFEKESENENFYGRRDGVFPIDAEDSSCPSTSQEKADVVTHFYDQCIESSLNQSYDYRQPISGFHFDERDRKCRNSLPGATCYDKMIQAREYNCIPPNDTYGLADVSGGIDRIRPRNPDLRHSFLGGFCDKSCQTEAIAQENVQAEEALSDVPDMTTTLNFVTCYEENDSSKLSSNSNKTQIRKDSFSGNMGKVDGVARNVGIQTEDFREVGKRKDSKRYLGNENGNGQVKSFTSSVYIDVKNKLHADEELVNSSTQTAAFVDHGDMGQATTEVCGKSIENKASSVQVSESGCDTITPSKWTFKKKLTVFEMVTAKNNGHQPYPVESLQSREKKSSYEKQIGVDADEKETSIVPLLENSKERSKQSSENIKCVNGFAESTTPKNATASWLKSNEAIKTSTPVNYSDLLSKYENKVQCKLTRSPRGFAEIRASIEAMSSPILKSRRNLKQYKSQEISSSHENVIPLKKVSKSLDLLNGRHQVKIAGHDLKNNLEANSLRARSAPLLRNDRRNMFMLKDCKPGTERLATCTEKGCEIHSHLGYSAAILPEQSAAKHSNQEDAKLAKCNNSDIESEVTPVTVETQDYATAETTPTPISEEVSDPTTDNVETLPSSIETELPCKDIEYGVCGFLAVQSDASRSPQPTVDAGESGKFCQSEITKEIENKPSSKDPTGNSSKSFSSSGNSVDVDVVEDGIDALAEHLVKNENDGSLHIALSQELDRIMGNCKSPSPPVDRYPYNCDSDYNNNLSSISAKPDQAFEMRNSTRYSGAEEHGQDFTSLMSESEDSIQPAPGSVCTSVWSDSARLNSESCEPSHFAVQKNIEILD